MEWTPRPRPVGVPLSGRTCRLVPLDIAEHGVGLHAAFSAATDDGDWRYLPYGPFAAEADFLRWLGATASDDPLFYTIIANNLSGPAGLIALMRIDAPNGVLEIGHVHFSRVLQRSPPATEAVFLLLSHAFDDLGYRRVEWKCDAAHMGSRRAAERLGFGLEGAFRQHRVVKGRNRDTTWFSILDREWPEKKSAFVRWLDPSNFDVEGRQLTALGLAAQSAPRPSA